MSPEAARGDYRLPALVLSVAGLLAYHLIPAPRPAALAPYPCLDPLQVTGPGGSVIHCNISPPGISPPADCPLGPVRVILDPPSCPPLNGAALLLLGQPMDLNTATPADLAALRGIGPKLAQAIVQYRTAHGPFRSVEGALAVSGIGPKRLEVLRRGVRVTMGAR